MKKITLVFIVLIGLSFLTDLFAQSNYYLDRYGLGGVTMTANSPVTGIISNTTQATSSSSTYLVSWDSYYNKWSNTSTPYNEIFTLTFGANNTRPDGTLSTSTTNGKFYTFQIKGLSYTDRQAIIMETDNTPQSFHATASTAVSTPSVVYRGQDVTINITLAGNKSAQEKVFIRYTTDNWTTSKVVEATGTGSTWSSASAIIPSVENVANATIKYYAYTTTASATNSSDHDLITLKLGNNSGANYSYSVSSTYISTLSGDWSSTSTWAGNSVPATDQNVIIDNNITLDANVSVSSLTINSGATFTASDASARTLTITKSASGSSTTLFNNGTWDNGTGGSTVVFTGAPSGGDAIHAVSGTIAFQNLTINKTSGTSNVGASFGAGSSLTGTLEIGTGGFISTDPPTGFYGTGSILKFNQGSGANYDVVANDKTWSTTEIPQNVTVTSGKVTVNENRTATGSLIISAAGTLELSAAKQLSIANISNAGNLTLKSAQNIGTATVITTGTVDGSGTTTVEQFVSSAGIGAAGRNWYISSPLSAATSSTISTETGNDLVYWNGTAWTAAGTTMDVMKGYIAVSPVTDKTIQFTGGSLNTGSQSVTNLPLGFNLVGNPYPSYVDFTNATKTNVTNSIWYRSKSSGSYVFQTYNVPSNIGLNDGTAIIPPLQSFWIKTTSTTNTFGFDNTMRSHQDQSIATNRLKIPAPVRKLARLEIAAGTDKDETVVYFYQNAQNTFDDYDSQKMFNEEAGAPEIYTFTDAKNLAINGQATIQLDTEIPIGFRTGLTTEGQNYSLKATQIQNFASDVEMVLVDKDNSNAETIMNEGTEYTFTSTPVNTTNRFSLVFRSKGTTTGGFGALNNKMRIQKNATNQLVVICDNNALKNASVTVYSAAGQKITEQMISSSNTVINVAFKAGVYVVKLQSEGKTYNTKVSF